MEVRKMGRISDLASFLVNKHDIKQKDAEKFISQMFDLIHEELEADKQVKVKGLGTFKLTTVKDRASVDVNTGERIIIEGRDKMTFTPDASMKNLVNKPFAQFETVILKEGVDFAEIDKKYNLEEAEKDSSEQPDESVNTLMNTTEEIEETIEEVKEENSENKEIVEEVKEDNSENIENVEEIKEEAPDNKETTEPQKEEHIEKEEVVEDEVKEEPLTSTLLQSEEIEDEEEMKRSEELAQKLQHTNNIVKVLCAAIAALVLLGIFGWYSMNNKLSERDQQIQQFVEEKQKEQERVEAEKVKLAKELEAYNNYDERVINGDYKIVGIEKEVTAVEGQTLKSISRMELGPGMDCYVQAVNPDIKMVLIGQQVKIPKLVHK